MTADLFVSCVMDQFYPNTAENVVRLLEKAGVKVAYNPEQTCCGKFAYHSGYVDEAKALGEKFIADFKHDRPIVGVSSSCVGYVKTCFKDLFHNTSSHLEYKRVVSNIHELTEFLVNVAKVDSFGAVFPHTVVYQDTCSSLRELHLHDEGRALLANVEGIKLLDLSYPEVCCGFGRGFFAVQHEAVSTALADRKLKDAIDAGAEVVVTNDISCLMHLDSYAKKQKLPIEVKHIADVLTAGW